jgi:hypothetical protein
VIVAEFFKNSFLQEGFLMMIRGLLRRQQKDTPTTGNYVCKENSIRNTTKWHEIIYYIRGIKSSSVFYLIYKV